MNGIADLERALGELARDPGRRTPEPRHARRLALALGEVALENEDGVPEELLERVHALLAQADGPWRAALRRDFELAVWEYDTSVDPRYLGRADYDHEYTREARLRIDLRWMALELLDVAVDGSLEGRLEAADQRYEPFGGPRYARE